MSVLKSNSQDSLSSATSSSSLLSEDFLFIAECTSFHNEKQVTDCIILINIDELFDLIFTQSKFIENFHHSLGYNNIISSNWYRTAGSMTRTKTVSYNINNGFSNIRVTNHYEVLECSVPNELYSINIKSISTGTGLYDGCFEVYVHICLKKLSDNETSIFVNAKIVYIQSLWVLTKVIIEKSVFDGLNQYYEKLVVDLESESNTNIIEKLSQVKSKNSSHIKQRVSSLEIKKESTILKSDSTTNNVIPSLENSENTVTYSESTLSSQQLNLEDLKSPTRIRNNNIEKLVIGVGIIAIVGIALLTMLKR